MAKLIAGLVVLFIILSLISAAVEGGGGIAAVQLDSDITASDTTLPVTNTEQFLDDDVVAIGNELIYYSSKDATNFIDCTRGYRNTTAKAHLADSMVYSQDVSIVNYALGYNYQTQVTNYGPAAIVTIPVSFFWVTLPRLIAWNYSFLTGDMSLLAVAFFGVSVGIVISIALAFWKGL